jgi:hypothetical protein
VSSSGLIYAVIVGAWAAYLVPMWLRRQDELNEARPTERFSTAIRLLSGRAAMERRVARARGEIPEPGTDADEGDEDEDAVEPDPSVDVRALAVPATEVRPVRRAAPGRAAAHGPRAPQGVDGAPGTQSPRAQVLARRRRTTTMLFVAFTVGAIAAAVGGVALLWAPAIPAVLLTLYIGQMRRQERRRYEVRLDQRQAAEAARRLRARGQAAAPHEREEHPRPAAPQASSGPAGAAAPAGKVGGPASRRARPHTPERSPSHAPSHAPGHGQGHAHGPVQGPGHGHPQSPAPEASQAPQAADRPHGRASSGPAASPRTADRRAVVEQTDHAEWVDQQRAQQAADDGWDPVPVPLPTYVTAPVAPRTPGGIDLGAPDTWSSARSGTTPAEPHPPSRDAARERDGREARDPRPRDARETPEGRDKPQAPGRRSRTSRTPLFDQYADPDRPRAANE